MGFAGSWPASWGPVRSSTLATGGMVSSSSPAVSRTGVQVLAEGGTAVDAVLAMTAMSWLALPGQCGVGGDAFAVVREPDGRVWTVNGSGYGPDGASAEDWLDRGLTALPMSGAQAVATPGALGALATLHAAAGATRSLAELWAPVVRTAREGLPCTAKNRGDIGEHAGALSADPGLRRWLLPDGRLPEVGDRLPAAELADSIERLATDPHALYTGPLAEQAVALLRAGGAPFSGEEWALGGEVPVEPSISARYGEHTVHQTPPPSPGWMVLQQAGLIDGLLGDSTWDAASVHALALAARRAFRDRYERCAADNDAWRDLLSAGELAAARRDLAGTPAVTGPAAGIAGDTTSCLAVDADGRAVSAISSLAFTFGARITIPGTGIALNNRLCRGAYLLPGHPNALAPRRKPLHTLNAWIATDAAGRLRHLGNSPGGDGQVQWNTQVLAHLTGNGVDGGVDPQTAVTAPRFTVHPGSDADALGAPETLQCEDRFGADVFAELTARGHAVIDVGPWGGGGSALAISVDADRGVLAGGADPRMDGVALGV
jgi:gamma-glutamyltranspeptidase/glutathione hydrolase